MTRRNRPFDDGRHHPANACEGLREAPPSAEDARAYCVRLTEQGLAALKQARPIMSRIDGQLLSALPPKRAEEFIDNLTKIIAALSGEEPKPAVTKPARKR